jgi:GIY-YIG catalytic domain.
MFNTLLKQEGVSPETVILVRHKDSRLGKGWSPFDLWRYDRPMFEEYQSHQTFGNHAKFVRASKWASFVGTPEGKTLFVGMYDATFRGLLEQDRVCPWSNNEVEKAGSHEVYKLTIDPAFQGYDGKLYIDWGDGARAWVQRADNQNKPITELREKYQEDPFPGFLSFSEPLSRVEVLPLGWITTLKASKGVYLLSCPRTREQYVGSATGADGFWGRWQEYCQNHHGGNIAFKSREPSDYQVSILEVAGSDKSAEDILAMEYRWIRKLQSREMGLNRNG